MDRGSDSLMGLLSPGKRIYRVEEREITREEFEAQKLVHTLVFGEKGLADTLGPTWDMIHDPRFEKIENVFIRKRRTKFGGDATVGVNRQLPDGGFQTGIDDLHQYAEILGEGRYFRSVLRSMAYHKAAKELFPERTFVVPREETLPGIYIFNLMNAEDQRKVEELAATYTEFYPSNLSKQSDSALWDLIKQECPNYFNKAGVVNQVGKDLFNMLRCDLVGLIDDYAEVAKIQEWVLLDHENTLVEQKHIDNDAPRVWAEVEILERALTMRADLRSTAAKIMKAIGMDGLIRSTGLDLTEFERDQVLKIIYSSNYPDDQPALIQQLSTYLFGLSVSGKTTEERHREQTATAIAESKAYVAKLKSGEIQPITRSSEPGEEEILSDEEKLAQEILHNPIKQFVFMRYASVEARRDAIGRRITEINRKLDDISHTLSQKLGTHRPDCSACSEVPGSVEELEKHKQDLKSEAEELSTKFQNLGKVLDLLAPVFATADYELTEEGAADLLGQAEAFDSTVMKVLQHPDDMTGVVQAVEEASPAPQATTA